MDQFAYALLSSRGEIEKQNVLRGEKEEKQSRKESEKKKRKGKRGDGHGRNLEHAGHMKRVCMLNIQALNG